MATTSSTNILTTLGAGSGIDTKSLAQSLADAEISPRKEVIQNKITKTEAKISGYGYLKTALNDLKTAFARLDDAADFASIAPSNTQPTAFGVTPTAGAQAGSYSLHVTQLAQAQRTASNAFAARSTPLNGGQSFKLEVSIGGAAAQEITVSTDTPAGVVTAINEAKLGVTAQILQTGDAAKPYTIVLTGQTGEAKSFTMTPQDALLRTGADVTQTYASGMTFTADSQATVVTATSGNTTVALVKNNNGSWEWPSGPGLIDGDSVVFKQYTAASQQLTFSGANSQLQAATNAELTLNGLPITRTNNQISDLIDGVTLDLYTTTSTPARLDLNRQTNTIKDHLKALVNAYNDLETTIGELGNAKSTIKDGGGSLASDSILQTIRMQVRDYLTKDSSTPGSTLKAARDAGLSFDRNGRLSLDEAKLDAALLNRFDEVVQMFTANTNAKSIYSVAPAGIAGDAVVKLDKLLRTNGLIATQADSASKKITTYQADLKKLDQRLAQILERYTKQFSAMDAMVGNTNSLKTSLKSSFEGMMATYTKN